MTDCRQRHEPDCHDRAERLADLLGTEALRGEHRQQHHQGDRHDEDMKSGRGHLQAFDRTEHGHGRGDHAVAEEQRGAEDAEDAHHISRARAVAQRALGQRHQRHDAAFAIVVGAHDDGDVLQGHHQVQRPERQRQHAQHGVVVAVEPVVWRERLLQGVQRAGTDIAEHHADRTDDQRQSSSGGGVAMAAGGGCVRGLTAGHGTPGEAQAVGWGKGTRFSAARTAAPCGSRWPLRRLH